MLNRAQQSDIYYLQSPVRWRASRNPNLARYRTNHGFLEIRNPWNPWTNATVISSAHASARLLELEINICSVVRLITLSLEHLWCGRREMKSMITVPRCDHYDLRLQYLNLIEVGRSGRAAIALIIITFVGLNLNHNSMGQDRICYYEN